MDGYLKFCNNKIMVDCRCSSAQECPEIFIAIMHNKFDDFLQLLGENDDERRINSMKNLQHPEENGRITPIMLACFYGRNEMLEYMLKLGNIDINHKDSTGLSCLQHAAHLNHDYY